MKASYCDLNSKFEGLATHVKGLENQIGQVASSLRNNGKGVLPGNSEPNPKEYCKAITLRSGKELPSGSRTEERAEFEHETDEAKDEEPTVEKEAVSNLPAEDGIAVSTKEKQEEASREKTEFELPPYEPKLPFPGRFKKQILDKQFEKFKKLLGTIQVTMPLMDLVLDCPIYNKLMKNIVTKKKKLEEAMVQTNHECSAIIQNNLPKKLQDPGSFTLPCSIGHLSFGKCLVDLGASVSLMPLTVSKKLGLTNFKKTMISLVLADRSVRFPIGVLEDLPLRVGEYVIPTDFVVLEMDDEPTDPIILGRPFLATAGAIIDVKKGIIDLHLGSSVIKFNILEVMKKPTIESKVFYIETLEDMVGEYLEELTVEDSLQLVLTKDCNESVMMNEEGVEDEQILNSHKAVKSERISELEVKEASNGKTSMEGDWSELNAPRLEFKQLPPGLKLQQKSDNKNRIDRSSVGSIDPIVRELTRSTKKPRPIDPKATEKTIDRATCDRSISNSRKSRQVPRSIESQIIDRSRKREKAVSIQGQSIPLRSIDPLPGKPMKMQRVWGALAKIRCPRPPSCFRASGTREEAQPPPLHK